MLLTDLYNRLVQALFLMWLIFTYIVYMSLGIAGFNVTDEQCEESTRILASATAVSVVAAPVLVFLPYPQLTFLATAIFGVLLRMRQRREVL